LRGIHRIAARIGPLPPDRRHLLEPLGVGRGQAGRGWAGQHLHVYHRACFLALGIGPGHVRTAMMAAAGCQSGTLQDRRPQLLRRDERGIGIPSGMSAIALPLSLFNA